MPFFLKQLEQQSNICFFITGELVNVAEHSWGLARELKAFTRFCCICSCQCLKSYHKLSLHFNTLTSGNENYLIISQLWKKKKK